MGHISAMILQLSFNFAIATRCAFLRGIMIIKSAALHCLIETAAQHNTGVLLIQRHSHNDKTVALISCSNSNIRTSILTRILPRYLSSLPPYWARTMDL